MVRGVNASGVGDEVGGAVVGGVVPGGGMGGGWQVALWSASARREEKKVFGREGQEVEQQQKMSAVVQLL